VGAFQGELMKPLTEEGRAKLRARQFSRWCAVVIFASLVDFSRHSLGWRFWLYVALFVLALGLALFNSFQLRQKPVEMSAT